MKTLKLRGPVAILDASTDTIPIVSNVFPHLRHFRENVVKALHQFAFENAHEWGVYRVRVIQGEGYSG